MMEIIFSPTSSILFMSHWCTLNKGVAASDKDAVEIQIERLLEQYQTTLKLHQQGQLQLAKERYESLISNDLVKKEPKTKLKDDTNQIEESPLSTLRFLVFKNYAAILETELLEGINDNNRPTAENSLKYYLQAVKIDPTEYSLWYNIGHLASLLGNHRFARLAFETGFYMDRSNEKKLTIPVVQLDKIRSIIRCGSLIPSQWKCLEGLCNTLYKIGDYPLCQLYIDHGKEVYPGWKLASELQPKLSNSSRHLVHTFSEDDNNMQIDNSVKTEDNKILLNLETPDWAILIKIMLDEYKSLIYKNSVVDYEQNETHMYSLSDIPFINHIIKINIEEPQPVLLQEPEILVIPDSPIETPQDITENNMDEDGLTNLQKRKREDNNEEGGESQSENDDESEAEEKRASLRASKRQRQKIVNEETSRREMFKEETEFTTKVRSLFDDISQSKDCFKGIMWYNNENSSEDSTTSKDAQFWEWFDIKVSELDSTYCWDIANSLKMKNDSNPFGNRKQTVVSEHSSNDIAIVDDSDIKQFVASLNQSNSGISDSICKTILILVNNDIKDTVMTEALLDHITDAITLLQNNFIEAVLDPSFKHDKAVIIMKICELYLDRLTRIMINTVETKNTYPINRRRASTSLAKQVQKKNGNQIAELIESWLELFEREVTTDFLNQMNFKNTESGKSIDIGVRLRYFVARGKLAQYNEDIDRAYKWYTKCKSLLQVHPISLDNKCTHDSIVNVDWIDEKLCILQTSKMLLDIKKRTDQKDYSGIIEHLEGRVNNMLDSSSEYHYESSETVLLLNYLAKAYIETDRLKDAWHYYARMFCYSIDELVSYGSEQIKSNAVLHKDEDTEFPKLLKCINDAVDNLVILISKPNAEDWFTLDFDQDLIKKLAVMLQMTILYVFRHSEFIPLVNNFKNPDVPPHSPSRTTRSSGFNSILVKSWVLESKLLVYMHQKDGLGVQNLMSRWAGILQDVHDDLGERVICGTAQSIFLKHLMNLITDVDSINYRRGIYQCYHCLYGIHLAAESEMIEEHNTLHSELDEKAAEALFLLVDQAVCDKLNSGVALKNDLKDAIDNISELFEELPSGKHLIEKNKQLISTFIEGDLKIDCKFSQLLREAIIPAVNLTPSKCHLSPVYFKIFWIRGKIIRLQIKNRQKSNSDKNLSDLEKAIEEFTNHLILNPEDPSGWYELGACLQQLAEEELNWSASNILSHLDTIGDYQKKACHAYLRCIYLKNQSDGLNHNINNDSIMRKKNGHVFMNFGDLAYSIVCSPMKLEALKPNTIRRKLGKDGQLEEIKSEVPDSALVYKLALTMYNQALRYNHSGWRCLYMISKCFSKLKRPPRDVLELYLQAIKRNFHLQQGDHDIDLEPIYTLCSMLVKYLYNGKIEAATVQEFLKNEKELYDQSVKENSDNLTSTEPHNINNNVKPMESVMNINDDFTTRESSSVRATHLPNDVAYAYNGIFDRLSELRKMDKKKWHHRIIYRISWMHYYVYHNAEKAKNEMMQLFTLRTTVKNHINIWIPGFELPGKHFEYVHKYTVFLIELAKETKDATCLKNLYKKLRRGQSIMLHDKEVYQLAYSAYLEIIDLQLRTVYHAEQILEKVIQCKIDKEGLQGLCDKYTKAVIAEKPKIESELMGYLQDLLDIKRLNHLYLNDPKLDTTIQLCYTAIAFSSENALSELQSIYPKVDANASVIQQIPNGEDETNVAENNLGHNDRLEILLQQAKILLQNSSIKP